MASTDEVFAVSEEEGTTPVAARARARSPTTPATSITSTFGFTTSSTTGDHDTDVPAGQGDPTERQTLWASQMNADSGASVATADGLVPVATVSTHKPAMFMQQWSCAKKLVDRKESIVCMDCKLPVDPVRKGTRLRSKKAMEYQCGMCNSTSTCMNTALGEWPSKDFKAFSAEEQVTFYRGGSKSCNASYAKTVAKRIVQERSETCDGELRPLLYWTQIGYSAERLQMYTAPEDRGYTDKEGDLFRVHVHAQRDRNMEQTIETQILQSMQDKKKIQLAIRDELPSDRRRALKEAVQKRDSNKRKRSPSDADSSTTWSSASSGSSDSKGSRKKRKAAKGKKEAEKNANRRQEKGTQTTRG